MNATSSASAAAAAVTIPASRPPISAATIPGTTSTNAGVATVTESRAGSSTNDATPTSTNPATSPTDRPRDPDARSIPRSLSLGEPNCPRWPATVLAIADRTEGSVGGGDEVVGGVHDRQAAVVLAGHALGPQVGADLEAADALA